VVFSVQQMSRYPSLGQILRVGIPALLLAQVLSWSLVSLNSTRLGFIAAELTILWFMIVFIRRKRFVPEDLLLLNATPVPTLIITCITAVGASLTIAEFDLLFLQLLQMLDLRAPLSLQRSLLEIQLVRTLPELALGLLTVVLSPGVCEELFFRGFVFTGLYVHHGPSTALAGSTLLFAAAHFNPWQLPALLAFGLFLCALVYITHSIYPAILAHVINNLLSVVQVNLRAYVGLDLFNPHQHLPLSLTVLAGALLLGGILLLRRQLTIMPLPAIHSKTT
jgi:membrane protease YdiL (CAAX protease family)